MIRAKILVIDDDVEFLDLVQTWLRNAGYEALAAEDGAAGLRRVFSSRPDLVLLDVMMGWVLEGVSVSREMVRQKELQRIPIIMVTSIRDSEYRGFFPQDEYLHINSWLDKPCAPSELVSQIEATLAGREKYRKPPSGD